MSKMKPLSMKEASQSPRVEVRDGGVENGKKSSAEDENADVFRVDAQHLNFQRAQVRRPGLGKMDCYAISDLGRKRRNNEDQFMVADLAKSSKLWTATRRSLGCEAISDKSRAKMMLVADGMGGHAEGQRASKLAAERMLRYVVENLAWDPLSPAQLKKPTHTFQEDLNDGLVSAVSHCQKSIIDEAAWIPSRRGMGTTLTATLLNWPMLHIAHVGDSRCYVCRDRELVQLTRDHTYAQAMVDAGEMTKEDAVRSQFANCLWNVVGGNNRTVEPDVSTHELQIGDTLLVCSDGLTNHVSDELINEIICNSTSARAACQSLVRVANEMGGKDNITAIVARFIDSETFDSDSHEFGISDEQMTDDIDLLAYETEFTLSESTIESMEDDQA
ncbi:PP2C family protein-serine/threonine phosphatase [Planctomycetes bacterium K23_9]|uniref:Serine/threonine phosphatase stp n=1 Tax=Stieleria marina TaxID=1930275 RepID=A0A517NW69_9BACT|nr:Serine/threonine phosphatase stp [Planctomycetes bacterium K23_9]